MSIRIEVWVAMRGDEVLRTASKRKGLALDRGERAVRFVPYDPVTDHVVTAAIGHILALFGPNKKFSHSEKNLWAQIKRLKPTHIVKEKR